MSSSPGGLLDCLADGDPEAARGFRILGQDRAPGVRLVRRRRDDGGSERLDEAAPIRLLLIADADHEDLRLEAEEAPGEGQGAPPLARTGLGHEARDAGGAVVEGLRDGRVRLVAAGRADALVLEIDARRGVERLLQRRRPVERAGAVDPVRLTNLLRDLDQRIGAHLLPDQLHREERRQGLRPDRLTRPGVERWRQRLGQVGRDVDVVRRQVCLGQHEATLGAGDGDRHRSGPP